MTNLNQRVDITPANPYHFRGTWQYSTTFEETGASLFARSQEGSSSIITSIAELRDTSGLASYGLLLRDNDVRGNDRRSALEFVFDDDPIRAEFILRDGPNEFAHVIMDDVTGQGTNDMGAQGLLPRRNFINFGMFGIGSSILSLEVNFEFDAFTTIELIYEREAPAERARGWSAYCAVEQTVVDDVTIDLVSGETEPQQTVSLLMRHDGRLRPGDGLIIDFDRDTPYVVSNIGRIGRRRFMSVTASAS